MAFKPSFLPKFAIMTKTYRHLCKIPAILTNTYVKPSKTCCGMK